MAKKFDPKAKAKKQKIIAAVLGVLLLGVLAYEVPSLMKSMNKKPPAASAAVDPCPGCSLPWPAAPSPSPPSPCLSPRLLPTPIHAAQAGSGQLLSFDRFSSKDPFVQQVDATAGVTPAAPAKPRKATQPKVPSTTPTTPVSAGTRAQPQHRPGSRSTARAELVDLGKTFPSSDPVFRLVALTRTTAKIGIAGGSLSTGDGTTTLTKGKKVTLMNTADGTRYELVLLSVS